MSDHQVNIKRRKIYTEEDLDAAARSVVDGTSTFKAAAKAYDIPYSSVTERVRNIQNSTVLETKAWSNPNPIPKR